MKHNHMVKQTRQLKATRKEAFGAAVLDRKNSLAQSIKASLRVTAPLKLKQLLADHKISTDKEIYNGIGMWKAIMAYRTTAGLHEEYVDHDREVERMRDDFLPDGCSVVDFAQKVNELVREHAPCMDRPFSSDAKQAEFIIRLMPSTLGIR